LPNISKPSSAKAMKPFEFCVLGLSELALFGAQTLRCPHKGDAENPLNMQFAFRWMTEAEARCRGWA
jgi:hypothetical protein